jgi:uncharacterized RDD family membrane protein YckC
MHPAAYQVRAQQGSPEVTTAELAGLWARLAAHLIDVLILAAACWGISFSIGRIFTREEPYEIMPVLLGSSFGLFIAGGLFYFTLLWMRQGQTLGKMALGIKVIHTDASPLGWRASLLRFLGYVLSWTTLFILFLSLVFDRHRQGFHDKMANTYVIVVPRKAVRAHQAQHYAATERA